MNEPFFNPSSLEPIFQQLFANSDTATEYPQYEKKEYYLSAEMIERHGKTLVETIAGIANYGRSDGLIMCKGRIISSKTSSSIQPIEDPERLDGMMRALIYPPVTFNISRLTINETIVDIISIPRSNQRPHFMQDSSGSNRFFIPLRGAANKATAARHQVDEMYQDSMLSTLRRAFPNMRIDDDKSDRILEYIAEIGYGLNAN